MNLTDTKDIVIFAYLSVLTADSKGMAAIKGVNTAVNIQTKPCHICEISYENLRAAIGNRHLLQLRDATYWDRILRSNSLQVGPPVNASVKASLEENGLTHVSGLLHFPGGSTAMSFSPVDIQHLFFEGTLKSHTIDIVSASIVDDRKWSLITSELRKAAFLNYLTANTTVRSIEELRGKTAYEYKLISMVLPFIILKHDLLRGQPNYVFTEYLTHVAVARISSQHIVTVGEVLTLKELVPLVANMYAQRNAILGGNHHLLLHVLDSLGSVGSLTNVAVWANEENNGFLKSIANNHNGKEVALTMLERSYLSTLYNLFQEHASVSEGSAEGSIRREGEA